MVFFKGKRNPVKWCHMAIKKRNQYFLVLSFILMGLSAYYFRLHETVSQRWKINQLKGKESTYLSGFLVYTPGCKIPEMDPYDVTIRKYVVQNNEPLCGEIPPLTESNQSKVWIVDKAVRFYNVTDISQLDCCYSEFWRAPSSSPDSAFNPDDKIQMSNDCIQFNISAEIPFEFIKVECFVNQVSIYKDFHAFIIPKVKNSLTDKFHGDLTREEQPEGQLTCDSVVKVEGLLVWQGGKWVSFEPYPRAPYPFDCRTPSYEEISVLIIGADSMSRLNFHRHMPKTKNLMYFLGAVEFFGYNKVQDNTFPNLVPLLSGYSVDEITFCWPNHSAYFDDCPWIWKNFSSRNYFTAFGEDACWMGIFNYVKYGFKEPPTDYYSRPFIFTSEDVIGHYEPFNTKLCIGHRPTPEVLFNYAYKFTKNMTYSRNKYWALFWESSFTHDFLNVPSKTDDIFYEFFLKLQEEGILESTALLFLSDHGMRWGEIRETYQGRMEEHLPFLFILLPEWFKKKYSSAVKNLQGNTHLLATHFDLHETMKDFMNLSNLKDTILKSRALESEGKRAASLFLPLSIERTCESAGIKPAWCTCQRRRNVSIDDLFVQKAVEVTINYLNNMLHKYKNCAKLSLQKIVSAHVEKEDEALNKESDRYASLTDYVVTFITSPGDGEFESVVRHRTEMTGEMSIVGDVSRINLYGSQSSCVSDYRIKLYCFCR